MDIKSLIKNANLSIENEKEITFEDMKIPYIIARKKHDFSRGKAHSYAEYYLFDLNKEIKSKISDYNKYRDFQMKLLAPYFYKHMNDLRWNLYVIFLVKDEEAEEILKDINVSAIENDDNYARKFFFGYEEALKFLERQNVFNIDKRNRNRELKLGQFQQWVKILNDIKLTGCLTEHILSNENVDLYLKTGSFEYKSFLDSSSIGKQSEINNKRRVDRVETIEMGKFREHCFEKTNVLTFGQVNLLHGPNGCGKTSITEAVELAITNEIKRLEDMKEKVDEYEGLKVILKQGSKSKPFYPGLSSSIYKQIDSDWYGVPNVSKSRSTLNKNFNRFNYLDADATSRFTKEQSLKPDDIYDYKGGLKYLFFDNETLAMEKRWMWYYDKFSEKQKKLEKELDLLEQNMSLQKNKLDNLTNKYDSNINEIAELVSIVKYKNDTVLQSNDYLQSIQSLYKDLESIKSSIDKLNDAAKTQNISCYKDIIAKEDRVNKTVEKLKASFEEIIRKKDRYNVDLLDFVTKENKQIEQKHKYEKELKQLERDVVLWQDIQHVITNNKRLDDFMKCINNRNLIKEKIFILKNIKIKYPGIENIKEDIFNEIIDKENVEKEITLLEKDQLKIDERIKSLHWRVSQIDSLKAKIKALGEEYLQISDNEGTCPLCGYHYNKKSILEESIRNLSFKNTEVEEIKRLEKERNDIIAEISKRKDSLFMEKSRLKKLRFICEAYKDIYEAYIYNNMERKDDLIFIYGEVQKFLGQEDSLRAELQELETMISLLQEEGYSYEIISIAENFKKSNSRFTQYINEGRDVINYFEYMLKTKDKFAGEITKIIDTLKEIETKKADLQSKIKHLEITEQTIYAEIEQKNKILNEMAIIRNYFSILHKYFAIHENDNVFLWIENYNELKTRCAIEISYLETAHSIIETKKELERLEYKKRTLIEQYERCITANNSFKLMPRLDDAVTEFLENNKERIIFFFQMLHRPKEFESKLEYVEKGHFKLRRKWRNEEVRCPQMSTGQRVSFALSVFFSLHLSAINAPKFIMLDEPVANLDDVHLLNLLDILRDFAINGIQIFFTTANKDVAGLFRRKFSFFEEEFKHFKFERTDNLPVVIKQISYNPNEDVGKEISLGG